MLSNCKLIRRRSELLCLFAVAIIIPDRLVPPHGVGANPGINPGASSFGTAGSPDWGEIPAKAVRSTKWVGSASCDPMCIPS